MALFRVDAEHRCIDRRLEIQPDDIGGFFLELRIVTGNIAAQSMRLEPSFGQDARYPDVVGAHFGGNLASRPMRRAIRRFALGQSQHSGLESNAFFAATPSTMPVVEATETFPNKALFPQSNGIDTAAHRPTGLGLTVAGRQTQNDLRAHGPSHASAPSSGSTLQHFSLRAPIISRLIVSPRSGNSWGEIEMFASITHQPTPPGSTKLRPGFPKSSEM